MSNQQWECPCGWTGHEDELISHCEFAGSREEPPEYGATCPQCGDDWEGMSEPSMCKCCEDVQVKNDGDICTECYTCMMEDRADGARDDALMM